MSVETDKELGNITPPQPLESDNDLSHKLSAQFRHISAVLQSNKTSTKHQVYGFASSVRGEGVTTITLGVAKCLAAETLAKVLLLECDLQKPTIHDLLRITQEPGLSDLLSGRAKVEAAIRKTSLTGLWVMTAGTTVESSFLMGRIPWLASMVSSLKSQFDFIILDLPPVITDPTSPLLANLAESTYLVVRAGSVPMDTVKEALSKFDQSRLRGTILNGTQNYLPRWLNRLF